MSNQLESHDGDTVENNDQEEIIPSTPGQEHIDLATEEQDNASLLGNIFNGDSIIANQSPFKKSFGSNTFDESAVALVNEPLPIESTSLSPFHSMALNSPLHSRSKDSHSFSVNDAVSVPDSLPPHVMELDSPEHGMEENNDFTLNIGGDDVHVLQKSERSEFNRNEDEQLVQDLFCHKNDDLDDIRSDKNFEWSEDIDLTSKKSSEVLASQGDLFESQPFVASAGRKMDSSLVLAREGYDLLVTSESNQPSLKISSQKEYLDEGSTPSSTELEISGEDLLQRMPVPSLRSPLGISPKRKIEFVDDTSIGVDSKLLKMDAASINEDNSDSDVEFLAETTSNDQSIEVLYDKKKSSQHPLSIGDCYDSQNLDLVLSATSQSQEPISSLANHPVPDSTKDRSISQSPSLLSMPDSVDLACKETLSSFEDTTQRTIETTIRATQVEMLCQPADISQPNIQQLLEYPITVSTLSASPNNSAISSTNQRDNDPPMMAGNSSVTISQFIETVASPASVEEKEAYVCSPSDKDFSPDNTSVISFPHFDTPSDDITTQSQESIFVKGIKSAEEQLVQEQKLQQAITEEKGSGESFENGLLKTEVIATVTTACSPTINEPNKSLQYTSSQSTSEVSFLFSQSNKSQDALKVTYVEDSDDESECNKAVAKPKALLEIKKADLKKTSTPNTSDVISPNISDEGQSFIQKTTPSSPTVNPQPIQERNNGTLSSSSSLNSTEDLPVPHNFFVDKDLLEAGGKKLGYEVLSFPLTKWMVSGKIYYTCETLEHENIVLRSDTQWQKFSHLVSNKYIENSKNRRISDISSISHSTTSTTSGYLGDKSSSDSVRLESTRLSMASITSVGMSFASPPRENENYFVPPKQFPPRKFQPVEVDVNINPSTSDSRITPPIFNDVISSSTDSVTALNVKGRKSNPLRSARGKTRGRGRRGRSTKKLVCEEVVEELQETLPSLIGKESVQPQSSNMIKDSEPLQTVAVSQSVDLTNDEFFSVLSAEQRNMLKDIHVVLSDEEETIFLRQCTSIDSVKNDQMEYIKSRVRRATIESNMMVFARYFDDNYYSAVVTKKAENDKWEVKYILDNKVLVVREVNILPTNILPYGLCCWVRRHNSQYSDVGIIKSHTLDRDGLLLHIIDVNRGTVVKASHSHIILKGPVANDLLGPRRNFYSLTASPNVNLDNIVQGKRRRDTPTASPSCRKFKSPVARKVDQNLDTSFESPIRSEKLPFVRKKIDLVSSETSEYDERSSTPKGRSTPKSSKKNITTKTPKKKLGRPRKVEKSLTNDEDLDLNPTVEISKLPEHILSPTTTPKKRTRKPRNLSSRKVMRLNDPAKVTESSKECFNIFQGYKFLITQSEKLETKGSKILDKEELKLEIEKWKGVVVDSFLDANLHFRCSLELRKPTVTSLKEWHRLSELPACKSPFQVLCISNQHCLTSKYIQCLAVGIPIVNEKWIQDSLSQNCCLNWFKYLLPAGESLLMDNNIMEQSYNNNLSSSAVGQKTSLLEGKTIFIASSNNPDFKEFWETTLTLSSAVVFSMPTSGGNLQRLLDRRTYVVLADPSIPEEQEKRAKDANVPIVSTQWFIQSLFAGEILDSDAHSDFNYKYVKKKFVADQHNSSSTGSTGSDFSS